jgi:glyoxalase family protein
LTGYSAIREIGKGNASMNTHPRLNGIHHITAIASSAADNFLFYQEVLGLRLVKRTVNFDDPYTYHLYYGDALGTPGTIITFFPWEKMPPGQTGAGMIKSIGFAVPRHSLDYWFDRLERYAPARETRFGDPVVRFRDPHGLELELIGVGSVPAVQPWTTRAIPREHAIQGFHSATESASVMDPIKWLLTDIMGMVSIDYQNGRHRFKMGGEGLPGVYYDVLIDASAPAGRMGAGTVHHVAFRAASDAEQLQWQARLRENGQEVTAVRDRNYFKSIYFNTPGGLLFEIATDSPGFAIDETAEELGAKLSLPSQYEPLRVDIEAHLPPLQDTLVEKIYE